LQFNIKVCRITILTINHSLNFVRCTRHAPSIEHTHIGFANGDFVDRGSDGSTFYFDAASRTKTNIDPDGSKQIAILDDHNNILSSANYDQAGTLLNATHGGSTVAFDGDQAVVVTGNGLGTSLALGTDGSGNVAIQVNGGAMAVFSGLDGGVQLIDAAGSDLGTVRTAVAADQSTTYTFVDANGATSIKTVSADGNSITSKSIDAGGSLISTTTRSLDPATGSTNYESDNLSNGTHTNLTISADGNTTQVSATREDGSTSDTVIVPGANGTLQSTAKSVLSDGSTSTDVLQMNSAGAVQTETLTVHGVDGSSLVMQRSADGVFEVATDARGDTATEKLNADGSKHIDWAMVNGVHGTQDFDAAGNMKETSTVHMEGTDILNAPMMTDLLGGASYKYKNDVTYEIHKNVDGTSGFSMTSTITGAFLSTEIDYPVANNGPQYWNTYPTMDADGVYLMHNVDGVVAARFTYSYSSSASFQVRYGVDTDRYGNANHWSWGTLNDNDHYSMRNALNTVVLNPGSMFDPSVYIQAMAKSLPFLPAQPIGTIPDFSVPGDSPMSPTSSVSGTVPADQHYLTLTGNDDLTVTGNALNNVIIGNGGDDTLIAGSGDAVLIGGSGHNTFVGGAGNTTVIAGSGGSDIHYSLGNGDLTIKNSARADTLHFGAGIGAGDISASTVTGDDGSMAFALAVAGASSVLVRAGRDTSTTSALATVVR
jgi:hypothetical protein